MTTPTDIIRNSIYSILNNVHTCMPGIIVSYDASTNKAIVQPALNKKFLAGEMEMPLLENVPIMFPSGGNFNMTFPVNSGDYVLLLFSERSIDLWLNTGGQVTPNDRRKFDLSDAIAIPGLKTFNSDFSQNDNKSFFISIGQSRLRIAQDGTICFHNQTNELIQSINDIVTAIQGLQIAVSGPAGTVNPAYNTSVLEPLLDKLNTFIGDC